MESKNSNNNVNNINNINHSLAKYDFKIIPLLLRWDEIEKEILFLNNGKINKLYNLFYHMLCILWN